MKIIEEFEKNEHSLWEMLEKSYNIDLYDLITADIFIKIDNYGKERAKNFILEIERNNNYLNRIRNEKEKEYFISIIVPLQRKFWIGKFLEKSLDSIRESLRWTADDLWCRNIDRSKRANKILPLIRKLCYEIYMFNKNAEIELNFFFKNYTTKPLMSRKLEKEKKETGEDEQFGLLSTDILK